MSARTTKLQSLQQLVRTFSSTTRKSMCPAPALSIPRAWCPVRTMRTSQYFLRRIDTGATPYCRKSGGFVPGPSVQEDQFRKKQGGQGVPAGSEIGPGTLRRVALYPAELRVPAVGVGGTAHARIRDKSHVRVLGPTAGGASMRNLRDGSASASSCRGRKFEACRVRRDCGGLPLDRLRRRNVSA